MNDSMKKPPMQKDAERLASQGRFGDSMLVHMNPAEVRGIASLVPDGRLTTNPQTGQPEAFLPAVLAFAAKAAPYIKTAIAAKGAYDAVKGPKGTGQTAARNQSQAAMDQYTQSVLKDVGQSQAYKVPKTFEELVASGDVSKATSFLPEGIRGLNLSYQRLPGMTYANLPGTTTDFYPQANMASSAPSIPSEPATSDISDLYKFAPAIEGPAFRGREISEENQRLFDELLVAQKERDFDQALNIEDFIKSRDMLNDGIFKIQDFEDYIGGDNVRITMADGGIAALAQGGDVDFPRMNGPISGPGTETSDDIPAMLSDGEFVVNAKAVRGVGKLNGADGSKEEQRRNGARMMYALQKAGEQAMRKT